MGAPRSKNFIILLPFTPFFKGTARYSWIPSPPSELFPFRNDLRADHVLIPFFSASSGKQGGNTRPLFSFSRENIFSPFKSGAAKRPSDLSPPFDRIESASRVLPSSLICPHEEVLVSLFFFPGQESCASEPLALSLGCDSLSTGKRPRLPNVSPFSWLCRKEAGPFPMVARD